MQNLRDINSTFFKKLNFTLPCAKSKVKFHCNWEVAISPDFNRISLALHLIRRLAPPSPQGEGCKLAYTTGRSVEQLDGYVIFTIAPPIICNKALETSKTRLEKGVRIG